VSFFAGFVRFLQDFCRIFAGFFSQKSCLGCTLSEAAETIWLPRADQFFIFTRTKPSQAIRMFSSRFLARITAAGVGLGAFAYGGSRWVTAQAAKAPPPPPLHQSDSCDHVMAPDQTDLYALYCSRARILEYFSGPFF
jgi:hypothetical protein